MQVNFLELVFDKKIQNDINKSILKVSDSSQFIGGKEVENFEKEYSKFLNIKETIAVGNGYDALVLSLKVLGISKKFLDVFPVTVQSWNVFPENLLYISWEFLRNS